MAEPKTLDNPNDNALREQMRQQRVAAGAAFAERAKELPPATQYSEPFTFRFRKIENGSFAGLWELAVLKPNGKVDEIVTDADALPNVLEAIGNIFANRGY